MPRGENGTPVTPDWVCYPRPCPFTSTTFEAVEVPENIILGSE